MGSNQIWISTVWEINSLVSKKILSSSPGKLLAAVLIGISSSWATSALFYELGAEIAYPVPESIVAGFMSSVSSLAVATVNAYIYFFSFVGKLELEITEDVNVVMACRQSNSINTSISW